MIVVPANWGVTTLQQTLVCCAIALERSHSPHPAMKTKINTNDQAIRQHTTAHTVTKQQ